MNTHYDLTGDLTTRINPILALPERLVVLEDQVVRLQPWYVESEMPKSDEVAGWFVDNPDADYCVYFSALDANARGDQFLESRGKKIRGEGALFVYCKEDPLLPVKGLHLILGAINLQADESFVEADYKPFYEGDDFLFYRFWPSEKIAKSSVLFDSENDLYLCGCIIDFEIEFD